MQMRKLQFSIVSILIGTAILAALIASYCYYFVTPPIKVRPASNTSVPIISFFKNVEGDYLQFAIWEDGTAIWRAGDELRSKILTTKVDPRKINQLFVTLSKERLLDPSMQRWHSSINPIDHEYYFAQIATTKGIVELSSWQKDAKENYNILYEGTNEMGYRYSPRPPGIKNWPRPYMRFIKNWDAIQAFAEGLKVKNADVYDGPIPKWIPVY